MDLKKMFSGYTEDTSENYLLGSGAYFKNYDIDNDTYDSAVTAGKLLGATRGGGQFVAKPEIRNIEIDGVAGKAKGTEVLDSWDVTIQANVIELTADNIKLALGIAKVDSTTDEKYEIISGKNTIEEEDYLDNITWVGKLSGKDQPIIIQVFNTLNLEGLTLNTAPKGEAVTTMTFHAHYDQADLDTPPYKIYYPKAA